MLAMADFSGLDALTQHSNTLRDLSIETMLGQTETTCHLS